MLVTSGLAVSSDASSTLFLNTVRVSYFTCIYLCPPSPEIAFADVVMFRGSGFLSLELSVKVYTSSSFVVALEIYLTFTRTSALQLFCLLSI